MPKKECCDSAYMQRKGKQNILRLLEVRCGNKFISFEGKEGCKYNITNVHLPVCAYSSDHKIRIHMCQAIIYASKISHCNYQTKTQTNNTQTRMGLMLAQAVLYMVILYQRVHESESSTTNALFMTAIQNVDMRVTLPGI